jgi:hypothetical protein
MEIAEAIEIVEKYLSVEAQEMNNFGSALPGYVNPNIKLQILHDYTEEYDFGWVFYYNSAKYIETGDCRLALVGNAPLIFDKRSKEIIVTGTAHDVSFYVDNYIKTGDPHNEG